MCPLSKNRLQPLSRMQLCTKTEIKKVSYRWQKNTNLEIRGKGEHYSTNSMVILFFPLKFKVNPKEKNLREVRIQGAMNLHVKAKQKALIGRRKGHSWREEGTQEE